MVEIRLQGSKNWTIHSLRPHLYLPNVWISLVIMYIATENRSNWFIYPFFFYDFILYISVNIWNISKICENISLSMMYVTYYQKWRYRFMDSSTSPSPHKPKILISVFLVDFINYISIVMWNVLEIVWHTFALFVIWYQTGTKLINIFPYKHMINLPLYFKPSIVMKLSEHFSNSTYSS